MGTMSSLFLNKRILIIHAFILMSCISFANDSLYRHARTQQRDANYDGAIESFKRYLSQPMDKDDLTQQELVIYTDALVQLMNTFQSKGEPEACILTLQEVYKSSPILQKHCLRDYYSVMGYALSRTEKMKEAEETMLKAFTIPLHQANPERYFRDYAYAAAVFYSNPNYQEEAIGWCQEALLQAQLCKNISGKQWVTAMLGSLYKRNGQINEALELFLQSKNEAQISNDDLGVLNSLHTLVDLFLYWDVPEYANMYASEAIHVEKNSSKKNPMISAQTYINKGRALLQLGDTDSIPYYTKQAQELCLSLPYNSGMVDVDLLRGIYLTEKGDDSINFGIQRLQHVAQQGTVANRVKAYHQLAQTYLKSEKFEMAEIMLDSLYTLQTQSDSRISVHLDYKPILDYFLKKKEQHKVGQYVDMLLHEEQIFKAKKLNFNLIEAIVDLQTEQQKDELKIMQLEQTNQRLWFFICAVLSVLIISVIVTLLILQKKKHKIQMKQANEKLVSLGKKLNQTNAEKEMMSQEINEILDDRENRQELERVAPSILQEIGESKFRQRFELLYPLFLPRLRERIPSITRREELLSMLIVLKQDNKEIAELLAIAPRSVLMLRHRFRQKIGLPADHSLESFIESTLEFQNSLNEETTFHSDFEEDDSSL